MKTPMTTPLHMFGDWLRDVLSSVPLSVVRGLFVAVPMVLLVWVLRLPAAAMQPAGILRRWDENLKLWAGLALVIQVVVYLLL